MNHARLPGHRKKVSRSAMVEGEPAAFRTDNDIVRESLTSANNLAAGAARQQARIRRRISSSSIKRSVRAG